MFFADNVTVNMFKVNKVEEKISESFPIIFQ